MPASGAVAHTLARLRTHVLRHVLVVGGLCLGIALILTVIDGQGFGAKLVYSFCIGMVCMLLVDLMRLLIAALSDFTCKAQGLPLRDSISGWYAALPGSLLAMVLGPTLGMGLGDRILGQHSTGWLDFHTAGGRLTLAFSLLGTLFSLVVIGSLERLHTARAQAEAAQRQAAETQLRLLQSQLEPHMLFNTLANLRVLIGLQPARAQEMLDHLIAFLRATLSASRSTTHPLGTEFERVADYLALMAVRMGARLQVQLDLPDELRGVPVPPLLLQPLVENAIKHGLEPQVAGGRIQVQARALGPQLQLRVRDTGVGLRAAATAAANPAGSHFGVAQVRERLATLYGAQGTLTLQDADDGEGGVLCVLTMPLPATAAAHPTPQKS